MPVSPKQLAQLLARTIPAGLPILITGSPGIGKTDIVRQSSEVANADFVVTHPVVEDPTDRKGIPWGNPKTESCTWLIDHVTKQLCTATKRTVWLMDDLGQATPAVQAAHMQWLLNRGVNGHKLSDFVTIVAATNRRVDRAGVSGILEPVKSRFASIVELEPNLNDWARWAFDNNIPAMLIAFLNFRPDIFSKFQATADLTNSPIPRTWAAVANLEAIALPPDVESVAMSGAVGEAAATEYLAFRKLANGLQNVDAIILNPKGAEIPSKLDVLYATMVALAAKSNDKTFPAIVTYAERLVDADRGEFAVLMIRECIRRDDSGKISHSTAFVRLSSGRVGDLYLGKYN